MTWHMDLYTTSATFIVKYLIFGLNGWTLHKFKSNNTS